MLKLDRVCVDWHCEVFYFDSRIAAPVHTSLRLLEIDSNFAHAAESFKFLKRYLRFVIRTPF